MSEQEPKRKFRLRFNPVELLIFLGFSWAFVSSAYQLFFDWENKPVKQVIDAEFVATIKNNQGRKPASFGAQSFVNVEVSCGANAIQRIKTDKVRLSGDLCGLASSEESDVILERTQIINMSNQASAIVFADVNDGTFLTDFLPLNSGTNPIAIRFHYNVDNREKVITQEITLEKI